MTLPYDWVINCTHMKLSPVLHFLATGTMKAFLALTFLAALSLAVSYFRLIRFSLKYKDHLFITVEAHNLYFKLRCT